ncbi:unnamed protein product, partial [Prorocentrum cordatum]
PWAHLVEAAARASATTEASEEIVVTVVICLVVGTTAVLLAVTVEMIVTIAVTATGIAAFVLAKSRAIARSRRFLAKEDPEFANYLVERRQAQGRVLAEAMKSTFDEHMAKVCGHGFPPTAIPTPPSAGSPAASSPGPAPFPPPVPGGPAAGAPADGLSPVGKAWLQSIVGSEKVPATYTRETLTTFLVDCISKDSDTKERVKNLLVAIDAGQTLPKTHKLWAARTVELLYGPMFMLLVCIMILSFAVYESFLPPTVVYLNDDWDDPYTTSTLSSTSASSSVFSLPSSWLASDTFSGFLEVIDAWWTINIKRRSEAKATQLMFDLLGMDTSIHDSRNDEAISSWVRRSAVWTAERLFR